MGEHAQLRVMVLKSFDRSLVTSWTGQHPGLLTFTEQEA